MYGHPNPYYRRRYYHHTAFNPFVGLVALFGMVFGVLLAALTPLCNKLFTYLYKRMR